MREHRHRRVPRGLPGRCLSADPWQDTGGSFVDESDLHLLGTGHLASLAAECSGLRWDVRRLSTTCSPTPSRAPCTPATWQPACGGARQRTEHRAFAASCRRTEGGIMCYQGARTYCPVSGAYSALGSRLIHVYPGEIRSLWVMNKSAVSCLPAGQMRAAACPDEPDSCQDDVWQGQCGRDR
jgi:hypothetical protein